MKIEGLIRIENGHGTCAETAGHAGGA